MNIENMLILKNKFKYHKDVKNKLLKIINEAPFPLDESNNKTHTKGGDNHSFYKHDWNDCLNKNRQWYKLTGKKISDELIAMLKKINYDDAVVHEMWFQQYKLNDFHGWHLHGRNFTGVYYVDFSEKLKQKGTEFINIGNPKNKFVLDVEEGDIIIFPSNIWHRSPKIKSNSIKAIISYNIESIINEN